MTFNKQFARWLLLLAGVLFLAGTGAHGQTQDIDPASDPNVQPYAGTPVSGYVLAWSDEFNANAVDTNKWTFRTGARLWSYQQPQNNAVSNGLYNILLKKETVGTSSYTAGGIISAKLFHYGYYETRMKVPPGRGWHTSFWMMKNILTSNDTAQVELDALENDSITLTSYGINNHRWLPLPTYTWGGKAVITPSLAADFHVIGCEYTTNTVKYFFDGVLQQTVATTNFTPADVNIWLTSVAANLGGTTNVDDSQLPAAAQYDYARFFILGPTSSIAITTPSFWGATLLDTNTALRVSAHVTTSDTNYPASVTWSKISGPGIVAFANASNADTTATFSTNGSYVLQCQAVVLTSTNTDSVSVAVKAPLALALRQGVGGYTHVATFIRGDSVNWNSGARDQFIVGRWNGLGMRSLFSFDLSSLDPNAVFQSVTLDVWTDDSGGTGSVGAVELRKLNATPTEGTGDGSSASNGSGTGATWLSRTGGTNVSDLWTNAGGDFATNVLSSISGYNATVANVQKTFPSSAAFVAAAQTGFNAGQPFNLLMISPDTESGANNYISRINSDDNATVEQRPRLTLTFTGNFAPSVTPGNTFVTLTNVPMPLGGVVSNSTSRVWSKVTGSGTVTFGNTTNPATTATFSAPGNYSLRLTASNALAQVSRDLAVTVVASPPQLGSPLLASYRFQFQIPGSTGVNYTVQASTNMTTWTNLFSTNPAALPFTWSDFGNTNSPRRFYRVLLGP